jgi:hypothetical protein
MVTTISKIVIFNIVVWKVGLYFQNVYDGKGIGFDLVMK